MDTIDRIFDLVDGSGKSDYEIENETGISHGSIGKWRKRAYKPSADRILVLAEYFSVSVDYLVCRTDHKELNHVEFSLTEEEQLLLDFFRSTDVKGRFRVIQLCLNEYDRAQADRASKGDSVSAV